MAKSGKAVSIRSIGAEIRKKQKELRGKKKKASARRNKAIDLAITRLEKVHKSVMDICVGTWLPVA
jgi:hypothetical protein